MEQKKYAEIIDKGECLSTINVPPAVNILNWSNLENIKFFAGRNEWEKSNFYPSNGLVGEIEGVLYNTLWGFDVYILKIQNKFYVPMSPKGIKFITKEQMLEKQPKNLITGMDERQAKINSDYDSFMRPFSFGKPQYKDLFKQDLVKNFDNRSNGFTKQLFIRDIEQDAIMYSCDICLEFDNKSGGLLSDDWVKHIASEVCDSIEELIKEFEINNRRTVLTQVLEMMNNKSSTRKIVDRYYYGGM
ncbi:hypothetical protein GX865_04935 [Candidatus Saccharibacteria bacterium]|nr:hypothetical protein [Candidatus Saccharibacteria bacterium]